MESPNSAANTPAPPTPPKKLRVKRPISPELAANVREEDEAYTATVETAQAVAQAALSAAQAVVAAAHAKRKAAMRPILRHLGLEDAELIGTDGQGADTVLILDVVADTASPEETNDAKS
jgi:hypothetical protein